MDARVHELLPTTLVDDLTGEVTRRAGERVGAIFARALRETVDRTPTVRPDGSVFVVTGDIPAMWLRDSTAQWQTYLLLLDRAPALTDVIAGVLRTQFASIRHDAYANAFNDGPTGRCHEPGDNSDDPWLWERKYEVDSLAFPVLLAHRLRRAAGRDDLLGPDAHPAMRRIVDLWRLEQDHEERSPYRFVRPTDERSETLDRDGLGTPVARTGMTWSGFRPSDDACEFGYNVPANLFAARALDHVATFAREVFEDAGLARDAQDLAAELRTAVARHGVVDHPEHGRVWAYEVDGLGGTLLADDANMPSLLSLPLLGACAADDPLYVATRGLVLSDTNPWFHRGSAATGIGSPHTPDRYVWPIGLCVQALTNGSPEEAVRVLRLVADCDDDTGHVHEGFHVDDPSRWTREWFSWADSTFCELALSLLGHRVTDLD
ncbi:glycoside hydrolase family 125 protein [Kineococcus sp. NPDC059986]|uniref:glycoside hydrolase family 125 protein n=1 Tax=Kineococcus sp. NPDC059986 TaxID=3155538 RepID=UPI00344E745D